MVKKAKKLKPKRKPPKIEFLTETKYGIIYLQTSINRLAKTISILRKQLKQVELEESEHSKGEI